MIHPPGSAEQVAAFQNAKISGMVFNPVTNSYVTQAEADAYMAIQRVHEANMEKQEAEGYQTFPKPPLGRNLEDDLHMAIERVYDTQKFLRSLHPDVRKIINLGELLK